jgi:hypothetical protein
MGTGMGGSPVREPVRVTCTRGGTGSVRGHMSSDFYNHFAQSIAYYKLLLYLPNEISTFCLNQLKNAIYDTNAH